MDAMNAPRHAEDPAAAAALDAPTRARLAANVESVRRDIRAACERCGRSPNDVLLLPITKYVGPAVARALVDLGFTALGESTVQETARKRAAFEAHGESGPVWHLVGHLQRNKAARALELCGAIHSLDSRRLAEEIERRAASRSGLLPELYVEVNVAGESTKTGLPPDQALDLLKWIHSATGLRYALSGLMTLAPVSESAEAARSVFRSLAALRRTATERGLLPGSAQLSMGMSHDFAVAIEEGANVVRIGSRLFEGLPSRGPGDGGRPPT